MQQRRGASPQSSRAKAAAWIVVLALLATACQVAPSATATPQDAPIAAPTLQVPTAQAATPTGRTELAATDPATVNLASGRPTLVEFFAFW